MEIIKDEKINKIIDKIRNCIKLTKLEGKVYVVGGAIRNSLLKLPINDLDIVVEGDGGTVVANLLAVKEKCYVLEKNPVIIGKYGTASLRLFKDEELKDIRIEFSGTRKCVYDPLKNYVGTIEEDSKRRDLSINALYWNINDGKLYDFNLGVNDLMERTLRTPDPYKMFVEDPIKMLRVIRFSSEYGWGIEKNTWLAMLICSKFIRTEPIEKINSELSKILVSPNPSVGIRKMAYCGLLKRVLPDIYDLKNAYESRNPMVTAFDHTMDVLNAVQPLIESRLAALFHDVGGVVTEGYNRAVSRDMFSADIAASDLEELKYSKDIIDAVATAIQYHRAFDKYEDGTLPTDKRIRKFTHLCGDHIGTTIDLMNANNLHCTFGKKKRQVLDLLNRMEELDTIEESKNVKLPVDGKDLIEELGLKRGGPVIGKLLNTIKEAYFENPKITKEECLELAKKEIKVLAV